MITIVKALHLYLCSYAPIANEGCKRRFIFFRAKSAISVAATDEKVKEELLVSLDKQFGNGDISF